MSLKMLEKFFCVFLILEVVGCGSSFVPGGGVTPDPSLSSPTASVVANVGSTNLMVLNNESSFLDGLSEDMADLIQDNLGIDTGGSASNRLTRSLSRHAISDNNTRDFSAAVPIDETSSCTGGGTKQFIGEFVLTANRISSSGTLSGDYSVIYNNCEEEVLFVAADSNCSVTTEVTGTFNNSLNIAFYDLDPYSLNRIETRDTVVSNGPIEFVVESGSTQTVTYSYSLFSHTQSSTDSYTGSLTFGGLQYDVTDIRDFIEDAPAASICP